MNTSEGVFLQVLYLQRHCGLGIDAVDELLNKKSGFKGLAGDADLRAVMQAAEAGSEQAQLALEVHNLFCIHFIQMCCTPY